MVLNAIVWVVGMDVPADGVESTTPSIAELKANLDEAEPANFKDEQVQKLLDPWRWPRSLYRLQAELAVGKVRFSAGVPELPRVGDRHSG